MAVTVIPNLTLVDDADTETGWVGASGGLDDEVFLQGIGSYTYQTPKNGIGNGNFTPVSNIAMSGANDHLYWWMRCDVISFCEAKSTGTTVGSGLMLRLTDGSANTITWHIAGSDTWRGEWKCWVQNLNDITSDEVYATGGTIDLGDIALIEWLTDNSNSGTIRIIDNTWIDVVRFGTGLAATGTSFTIADIEAIDQDGDNMYGIIQEIDGVYFVQGNIEIGDGTNITELNSVNETIAFRDLPVSSGLYGVVFTGENTSITADTMSILSSGDNDDTRPNFDVDATVTAFTMDGSSINRADYIVFNDDCVVTNSKFNNCNTVTPTLAEFGSNTVSSSNHVRALEVDSGSTTGMSSCNFLNNFSAATWYAFSGTYTDYSNHYDGNLYDVENSSSDEVTINLDGTSDASSKYENPGTITLVSTTNFTLTNLQPDTEVRIYLSGATTGTTTAGEELYGVESVTGSTTYQYGQDVISSGHNCIVMIHAIQYENIRLVVDLIGTDSSLPIQQQFDRNYSNPNP